MRGREDGDHDDDDDDDDDKEGRMIVVCFVVGLVDFDTVFGGGGGGGGGLSLSVRESFLFFLKKKSFPGDRRIQDDL